MHAFPSVERRPLLLCCLALALYLGLSGLYSAWGMHDNDWPLLMWLAHAASWSDPSPLFIGHYPPAQLLLVRALPFNTLAAAKLLNIGATVGSAALVYATARSLVPRTSADRAWGLAALALFALSAEALLTGQSEYADPLATCALLGGLYCALGRQQPLLAGLLLALAGWFRLHFVVFGFGVCVLFGWRTVLGYALGAAPMLAANYAVTGQWFSPVAGTFLGQVLFGYDELNFAETYAQHPFVLSEHWYLVLDLMRSRLLACPTRLLPLVAVVTWGLFQRDVRVQKLWLCCTGYYLGVLCLGWEMTTRLLLPLVALLSLGCVAVLAAGRLQHRAVLAVVAFVLLRVMVAWHAIPDELNRATDAWDGSTQLTVLLRELGMREPREAFVVDWRRAPTDTTTLSAYYNFGFWNLLNPRYAIERPITQLQRNGIKWIVVSTKYPWRPPFPARFCGARTTDLVYCVQ